MYLIYIELKLICMYFFVCITETHLYVFSAKYYNIFLSYIRESIYICI